MEKAIALKARMKNGEELIATFLPLQGMNLISYTRGDLEIIDQSTRLFFEERYAGLGAMIGPHFHRQDYTPFIEDESAFPHIARVRAKGAQDLFSHGIGRYAPWKILSCTENELMCELSGEEKWCGNFLKTLEGQNFFMTYRAHLSAEGLNVKLSVKSEKPSVVGLHTYYKISREGSTVSAQVENRYNDQGKIELFPENWPFEPEESRLVYPLNLESDFGFFPAPDRRQTTIILETSTHKVHIHYASENEDNSWQLWHPRGASFACIEPLSAKEPRAPVLKESQIEIQISIHR